VLARLNFDDSYGYLTPAAVAVTDPIIAVFTFHQRSLVHGLTASVIKG
jgi:ABC-type maltose transport system permease subunit